MAFKKYSYYLRGSELAIVESSTRSSSGVKAVAHCTIGGYDTKDTCEAAGGQWIPSSGGSSIGSYEEYKSPTETISDGLEIEYSYSPIYWNSYQAKKGHIFVTADERNRDVYCPAYGEESGYLTFFFPSTVVDVGGQDMSSLTVGNYIIVNNHPHFNGIHKIKSVNARGVLQTETKWASGLIESNVDDSSSEQVAYTASNETITVSGGNAEAMKSFNTGFNAGDYIWIGIDTTQANNRGLFKISSLATSGLAITVDNQYYSDTSKDGDLASATANFVDETFGDGGSELNWTAKKVLLSEGCTITLSGVNFMEDESFEIDIDAYISKALVYYLKAKMAEDKMEIEVKEYFMREFYRLLDKYDNRRIHAMRTIQAPLNGVR